MRQFATQRAFFEPAREFTIHPEFGGIDFNQLVMLAVERAFAPPVVHRRSVFQPMRIVIVDPNLISRSSGDEPQAGKPNLLPRALPAVDGTTSTASQVHQRKVRGEILSDEGGRLYEKVGRQIRPIHQLASGPFGEVIDLVPAVEPRREIVVPPSSPKTMEAKAKAGAQSNEERVGSDGDSATAKFEPLQHSPAKQETAISHHKLFADPGQWRVVWWGEFKEILARQLAHPERLRDTYRLPCYVQVIETERTVAIEELAGIYKAENKFQTPLYVLTDDITAKLDLILPLRPVPPLNARRPPNTLLPHERVFRLIAANDPTIDVSTVKNKLQSTTPKTEPISMKDKDPEQTNAPASLKEVIPNSYVKEWEFKLNREEASYDMNAKPSLGSLIRNFCRRLRIIKLRNEFRKWQTLLAGKNAEEQLWAVRPPAGMLTDSFVRNWATRTLELGGYDSKKMISEWEIFWRRKGS